MPDIDSIMETLGTIYRVKKLDIAEVEGNRRFIAGYANIAGIVDNQNEVVTIEALQKAWEQFKKSPEYAFCMLVHQNIPIAKVIFESVKDTSGNTHTSGVDERGLYIVAQIRDNISLSNQLWKDIEDGKVRGFSIGGRDLNPQPIECEGNRCFSKITDLELYEVSIVPSPANKVSLFNILKGTAEMDDTLKKIEEALKSFQTTELRRSLVEISKTRNTEGNYELYVDPTIDRELYKTLLAAIPAESWESITPVEEKTSTEYIPLFDISLSSPTGHLTEDEAVGSNPSLDENKPKKEGETPMSEESEEIRENTTLETSEESDESKPVEQPEAPLTLETIAADVAFLRDMVESMKADIPEAKKMDEIPKPEEAATPAETPEVKPEETPVETPAETPTETPTETPEEAPVEPVPETPEPEPQPTPEPAVEPAEAKPETPATAPPAAPTGEMETRGVNIQPETVTGFDPMAIHNMSFDEIAEMTKPNRG